MLADNLIRYRSLSRDDERIVERMNESQSGFLRQAIAMELSFRIMISCEHDLRTAAAT